MSDAHIRKSRKDALEERMRALGIREEDLVEKFVLGSGRGGQKVNKTSSCVYLKHVPSGIEVKCQVSRSRELNRYKARKELADRYQEQVLKEKTERRRAAERIRRQKRRRSRRQKERMLQQKHRQSDKKAGRRPVTVEVE